MTIAPDVGTISAAAAPCSARAAMIHGLPQVAGGGEAAQGGGDEEPGDTDPEGADAADPVAELAAEGDQGGQGEHVGVDHPLLAGGTQAEILAHHRERHRDHGLVEHDHRQRPGHRDEDQPAVRGGGHRQLHPAPVEGPADPDGTGLSEVFVALRRRCAGSDQRSAAEQARREVALDLVERHPLLRHRVALAHRHGLVVERVEVDRDAERRADLVLAAVATADRAGVVEVDVPVAGAAPRRGRGPSARGRRCATAAAPRP